MNLTFSLSRSVLLTLERGIESPLKQPYQLEECDTLRLQSGPQRDDKLSAGTTEWHIRRLVPEQTIKEEELGNMEYVLTPHYLLYLPSFIQMTVVALTFCSRNILCALFHFQQY